HRGAQPLLVRPDGQQPGAAVAGEHHLHQPELTVGAVQVEREPPARAGPQASMRGNAGGRSGEHFGCPGQLFAHAVRPVGGDGPHLVHAHHSARMAWPFCAAISTTFFSASGWLSMSRASWSRSTY